MVVDVHYHLMPRVTEEIARRIVRDPVWASRIQGIQVEQEDLVSKAMRIYEDPDGHRLLERMDEAGIDLTCIMAVDNASNPDLDTRRVLAYNRFVANVAQMHPKRVIAFAGVDPRRPQAPELLRVCLDEYGMRGLKYHPDHGYDPSSPQSYRLLEILQQREGVLLTHTGPLGPPARPRFADPMLLSDLAVDFPQLKVIAAHMGLVNWRPWAALASHQPNLYGDLAMWDVYAFGRYEYFCRQLRDLLDSVGLDKVLFASDGPVFDVLRPAKQWVDLIRSLPSNSPEGITFTRREVEAILGDNAVKVLALET